MKQGKSVIWLFLKMKLSTTLPVESSRRELSIDGIFKNTAVTEFHSSPVLGMKLHT